MPFKCPTDLFVANAACRCDFCNGLLFGSPKLSSLHFRMMRDSVNIHKKSGVCAPLLLVVGLRYVSS